MDFNGEFITRMLSRLEWPVVKQAAVMVRIITDGIFSVPGQNINVNHGLIWVYIRLMGGSPRPPFAKFVLHNLNNSSKSQIHQR